MKPTASAMSAEPAGSAPSPSGPDPVRVSKVAIAPGRLTLTVEVPEERFRITDPKLMAKVLQAYPTLPHHTCINGRGPTFAAVMESTSLPHLLEHLIIEEQLADPATPLEQTFVGATEWADKESGIATVEVSFTDDVIVLAALSRALSALIRLLS